MFVPLSVLDFRDRAEMHFRAELREPFWRGMEKQVH
jgi:hypothetical protein